MKRVKKLPENPNALFLSWLEEFLAEAEAQGHNGLMKIYRMCIESLKKYGKPNALKQLNNNESLCC